MSKSPRVRIINHVGASDAAVYDPDASKEAVSFAARIAMCGREVAALARDRQVTAADLNKIKEATKLLERVVYA
jgi:hypothetical protein